MISLAASLPLFLLIVSCQEQVINDMKQVSRNSANVIILPPEVQSKLESLQKANPSKDYSVIYLNPDGKRVLEKLMKENPGITSYLTMKLSKDDTQTYYIVEKGTQTNQIAKLATPSDSVFTIVEEQPSFVGGYDSLAAYIKRNVLYPENARKSGIQGKVFVSFVVTKDGTIAEPSIVVGKDVELDKEALRVVSQFPRWTPGKQGGKAVNARFMMPINFHP